MVDLSSCYFCGAAMDASLREHAVVPAAFSPAPDRQTTVVLCGTCERKLERVLDPVVDAAAARRRTAAKDAAADGVASTERGASNAGDGSTGGDAAVADDDAGANVQPGALSDLGDDGSANADADDAGTASGDEEAAGAAEDGTPFEVDDTASVFDDGADDAASDSVFADDTDASTTTTIPDAEADRDAADGIAFDDQSSGRATDDAGDATSPTSERTNATASDGPDADSGSDADGGTDAPDVDPRTYNKVVRLLKNRDLPVARSEIEAIAGSAYDIPDHECEAIVDAAIQRGLVAEDGNQLTYPDGV